MDLRLYSRVIWRFRYLVLGGLVVAMVLAFLATFHVGPHGVSYRQQKTYRATQTLWLTSKGSLFDASKQANLAQVAVQYVNIANSDIVLSRVLKVGGRVPGAYAVVQVPGPNNSLQPVIAVSGVSHAPGQAVRIADRISEALRWWSDRSQNQQAVSADQRVQVDTISRARPVLFEGRKLTVPIIIFLSVLIVTFGLIFILENRGLARRHDRLVVSASLSRLTTVKRGSPSGEPGASSPTTTVTATGFPKALRLPTLLCHTGPSRP